jgi:hypothetical protein
MKQSDISDRIIVEGSEDPSFTGNFEITLSATAEAGIVLPARLIHSKKTRGKTDRRATSTAERDRIVAAIVTYLERLQELEH